MIITFNQLCLKKRRIFVSTKKKNKMKNNPFLKGTCVLVFTISPKKPNSAVRKVCKVRLNKTGQVVICFIPGEKHNLQEHSIVLVKGGRTPDLPGVKYKIVRGVFDCAPVFNRKTSRSKYGVKRVVLFFCGVEKSGLYSLDS